MSTTHRQIAFVAALAFSLNIISSPPAFAHGDEVEVSNEGPRGPVSLTEDQVKALGLKFVQADLRPIARLLGVNGGVAVLPDAQTQVSLRISGNVQAVYVNLGDSVRIGQKLALIESRSVGNPPPTVVVPAPADGIIDARNISVGQSVEPNTLLFNLSDRSRMRVVGKVYEEDFGQIHVGQPAFVKLLAYPDILLTGIVGFVGPTLDPETRTVDIWVLLENNQGLLKPNLFAHVDIVLGENKAALTVPNGAVLDANGEKFVFVHDGEKYNRVDITVGAADDQYTEVQSGIVPGDEVVTQGARQLYTLWLTGAKK